MNVTELARKLKVTTNQLLDILPAVGIDIGRRAIKIDDHVAHKIISHWEEYLKRMQQKKILEKETIIKDAKIEKRIIKIPQYITVKDFAQKAQIPVSKVLYALMKNGVLSAINEKVDYDSFAIISSELGVETELEETQETQTTTETVKEKISSDTSAHKEPRPPVIVVLGHVDHGKTKLLDTIRKTNVAGGEAGGITQHIGAYQIVKNDRLITFIDTPGHESFSMMRSRGAKIADIAILVIAVDDGMKPQTVESIKIIKSAKIPLVVAMNKIDKPEANIQKVKQELANHDLIPEDWGGKIPCVPISAKTGQGIDDLLTTLILIADINKDTIVSDIHEKAQGTIIESHIDKGEGPVATVLIQIGTLKPGNIITINNNFYGKVRSLKDFRNKTVDFATPSTPVKILGLKALPGMGDILIVSDSIEKVKKIKDYKLRMQAASSYGMRRKERKDDETLYLNIILKADVLGSLEAITASLDKMQYPEVKVQTVSKGLGNISENDVLLAESQKALILGFHVIATKAAENIAQEKKVDIKTYKIIYEMLDEIKRRLEEMLSPEIIRTDLGKIKVLAIFRKEKKNIIFGGRVTDGKAKVGAKAQIFRNDIALGKGIIAQLQYNKIEVEEAPQGKECGIRFEGPTNVEIDDILEIYTEETKKKTLGDSE